MARTASIRNETILDAARRVFMRDGYKGSTARIAREAGISEGSLFKHFRSKPALFMAAMELEAGDPAWEEHLLKGAGHADPRQALESAGMQLMQQLRLTLPRLIMVNASGLTIPNHHPPGEKPCPLQKMDVFRRYFAAEMRAGRMRMANPQIQAHLFIGALAHYAWCETLFGHRSGPPSAYVQGVVDTILKAVDAAAAGTPRSSRTPRRRATPPGRRTP